MREPFKPPNESTYSFLVRKANSADTPLNFLSSMQRGLRWLLPQLTTRTDSIYYEIKKLLDEIDEERPRSRIWHPPLAVRVSKASEVAAMARYTGKRERVMALFEEANTLLLMEPFVAAQHSFADKDGRVFNAMADFWHPDLDLYVEIKHSHLNGKTSKTTAENAYDRIEPAMLYGKHASYYQIQAGWNHAAAKQAIVQSKIGAPQFAAVFTKQPDNETLKRIERQGIQAYSLRRFAGIVGLQLSVTQRLCIAACPDSSR
jgi:hypothetical protein